MLEELADDIREAARGVIERAQVERGAAWIDAFGDEYPVAHGILIASLYQEPKDVMRFLCVLVPELRPFKGNEHVLKYIALLQKELRGTRNDSIRNDRTTKSVSPIRRS
jgi:hypothetical protein